MSEPQEPSTLRALAVVERSGSPAVIYGIRATLNKEKIKHRSEFCLGGMVKSKIETFEEKLLTLRCDFNLAKVSDRPTVVVGGLLGRSIAIFRR